MTWEKERKKEKRERSRSAIAQGGSNMSRLRALALAKLHSLASSRIHEMMVLSVDDFLRKILAFRSLQIAQHTRMKRDATPFLAG
jgi:hypothetical protein